ncbi:hypothetical protein HUK80_09590 [Flavobacterium sp. MAH-1]|uniref:Uncharacterized protein n=1 Tax=Flavobacterium agri TaxID=2743471 RepID=A0A7Y8Y215_9FLAO|nr:hypothetical protein [Flavobacterium agri]NUY81145.1 hypothetical protein [Flavobacterium agri]NYA71169.1 hypothetical protein [Flavobacterium agri]
MKSKNLLLMLSLVLLSACTGDDATSSPNIDPVTGNKVLMLKVDYTTNEFEGGTEFTFDEPATTFTVTNEYQEPGDFGWVKLYYDELDTKIFDGEIHWMGLGTLHFPESFEPADSFQHVLTDDYATPNGFENVFNPSGQEFDYNQPWSHVQGLVKVRQYLQSNPEASAKIFLYTPSVGIGNPADWDWIIILKN